MLVAVINWIQNLFRFFLSVQGLTMPSNKSKSYAP